MAIEYISAQTVTNGNTVTIPANTTMAIGLTHRGETPGISTPTLDGTPMTVGVVSSDYVGIYYVDSPVAGTYTLGAVFVTFIYFKGTNGVRAGAIASTNDTSPLSTSILSSYDDFVICNAIRYTGTSSGNISYIKIDGTEINYITNYHKGYRQASGESAAIEVSYGAPTLYYAFMSIKSLVASDQSTFMTMIV
jgi:hypothetical protein